LLASVFDVIVGCGAVAAAVAGVSALVATLVLGYPPWKAQRARPRLRIDCSGQDGSSLSRPEVNVDVPVDLWNDGDGPARHWRLLVHGQPEGVGAIRLAGGRTSGQGQFDYVEPNGTRVLRWNAVDETDTIPSTRPQTLVLHRYAPNRPTCFGGV